MRFKISDRLPEGANLPEGWYEINATVEDEAGNRLSTEQAPTRVLIDRTPPKVQISSPPQTPVPGRGDHHLPEDPYVMKVMAQAKAVFPAITGIIEDISLERFDVMILRKADNHGWNGTSWTLWSPRGVPFCRPPTTAAIPAQPAPLARDLKAGGRPIEEADPGLQLSGQPSGSWSCSQNLPGGENLPLGHYVIYAQAYDKAGHVTNTIRNVLVRREASVPQDVFVPGPQPPTAPTPARPAPPADEVKAGGRSTEAYIISKNPELKGRLGRLVVAFPEGAEVSRTRTFVSKAGEKSAIKDSSGNQAVELLPGSYDVYITGKRVEGVPIKSGHDTTVRVGVLRIHAGKDTRVYLLDADKTSTLAEVSGTQELGFPIGTVHVHIAGQTDTVTIEDGKIIDF